MAKKTESTKELSPAVIRSRRHHIPFHRHGVTGRRSELAVLIEDQTEEYGKFIAAIKCGVFYKVAAQAIGVCPTTVINWMTRGRLAWEDFKHRQIAISESDRIYYQFFSDVNRARAAARSFAESTVFASKPEMWLKQGPDSRNPEVEPWRDDPALVHVVQEFNQQTVNAVVSERRGDDPSEQQERDVTGRRMPDLASMLQVLADAGMIELTEQGQRLLAAPDKRTHDGNGNGRRNGRNGNGHSQTVEGRVVGETENEPDGNGEGLTEDDGYSPDDYDGDDDGGDGGGDISDLLQDLDR